MPRVHVQLSILALASALFASHTDAEDWWAFKPPDESVLQAASLDDFIQRGLERQALRGSAEADRRTLIRRVTFDLTGLPPTMEEVSAFMRDESPDAYEKLIDRLLGSPHYGERWARHWLDVARYSDTKGYVYAREEKRWVHAWPYRDWVVRSLNEDMPYDRFLLLQIAADQVAPPESPDLAAMGFLTLGRRFLGVTHDIIDDRIDVITRGLLGLTVACARCHDHKFDPIPTRDYYSLYGVFRSCREVLTPCGGTEQRDKDSVKKLRELEDKVRETMRTEREAQSARVREKTREHLLAQFELEKYPEETFNQLLGKEDINPEFVRRWQQYLVEAGERDDPVFAAWHAFAKLPAAGFSARAADAAEGLRRLPVGKVNTLALGAFATPPAGMREVAARYGDLFAGVDQQWRELQKANPDAAGLADAEAEALRRVLHGPDSPCQVPDEHIANNEMFFPTKIIDTLWKAQGDLDRYIMSAPDAPQYATILVDRAKPVTARVFTRGNPLTRGEPAPRGFLSILSAPDAQPFAHGSGRLEMAQAIINPANPLTARVMVNRVWAHHFGRGLVATPSDFGVQGELPSHPELLDWLALRFIQDGWSLKKLHRLIMLSAAYRQNSTGPANPAALARAREIDPGNRLLWRMSPRRLDFEEVRDAWLAASGEIDLRIGGRPEGLLAGDNNRRTLYSMVNRENLPAVMRTFDFANPDLSIPKRAETIVPQQALFGLNHPFVAARAEALGRTVPRDAAEAGKWVQGLYRALYQREPTPDEIATAMEFVQAGGTPDARPPPPSQWLYGYGALDEAKGRVMAFHKLPYFNGSAWQGGEDWPDAKLGWVQITATGGHAGNDRNHAAVRRWVAPQDGTYAITSTVIHEPKAGDGIRAFISHGTQGLLRSAVLHASRETLDVEALPMRAGETLDFVVDIRDGLNNDLFLWAPRIALAGQTGTGADIDPQTWDAEKEFAGEPARLLNPWQQLAQVLLLANEFMFVD